MKKIAVMIFNNIEEVEALFPVDLFRRAGIHVDLVSLYTDKKIMGSHNIEISAEKTLDEVDFMDYDCVFLPGGLGTSEYFKSEILEKKLKDYYNENNLVAAICAAPKYLAKLGLLKDKKAIVFSGLEEDLIENGAIIENSPVVKCGNLITGRSVAAAKDFGLAVVEYLLGEDEVNKLKVEIINY
ncbi:DJ-1 family glyoxalase III [Streptobacillus notomytis]|uniref:DJ-1 family glyoxalase III n=1 Tax=Streptobacillus notomytis TaxID=1712031 RepID=UPI0008321398|nr:DJ-1 family glyoxalase III [Streptobacillus notomytis]